MICTLYSSNFFLYLGNPESSGRPNERSPMGGPATKHLEGGPSSWADSWSCGIILHNTNFRNKKSIKESHPVHSKHIGMNVPLTKKKYLGQTPKLVMVH